MRVPFDGPGPTCHHITMRVIFLVGAILGAGCKSPPPPDVEPPAVPPPAQVKQTCDDSKKPRAPHGDVGTPQLCSAANGTWVDHWQKVHGYTVGTPLGVGGGTGWQVLGRGNQRYRGCTHLSTTDGDAGCRYDGDCQGRCLALRCSAFIEPDNGLGCRLRCQDGQLQSICAD